MSKNRISGCVLHKVLVRTQEMILYQSGLSHLRAQHPMRNCHDSKVKQPAPSEPQIKPGGAGGRHGASFI